MMRKVDDGSNARVRLGIEFFGLFTDLRETSH